MSEGEQLKPTPVADFYRRIEGITDFSEYLHLLVQEGISALSQEQTTSERPEQTERRWVGTIGIWTAGILMGRKEAGLPNNPLLLSSMVHTVPRSLFQEFIVDEEIKRYVYEGLVLGLGIAEVIPSSAIIQPLPQETVSNYFKS